MKFTDRIKTFGKLDCEKSNVHITGNICYADKMAKPILIESMYSCSKEDGSPQTLVVQAYTLENNLNSKTTGKEFADSMIANNFEGLEVGEIDAPIGRLEANFENSGMLIKYVRVDQNHQRQGIGSKLIATAEDIAKGLGYNRMSASTLSYPAGIELKTTDRGPIKKVMEYFKNKNKDESSFQAYSKFLESNTLTETDIDARLHADVKRTQVLQPDTLDTAIGKKENPSFQILYRTIDTQSILNKLTTDEPSK